MSTKIESIKNGTTAREQTFIFEEKEEIPNDSRFKSKILQIFPVFIGSLMCLPFGIMLGWPSPTYPKLLALTSPIPISLDQTAMIAGFLMIGNLFSTLISTSSFFGTKYGIVIGLCGMVMGWIIMWFASDIYYLLSSRIIIGLSFGYGVGQLKIYIKELCQPNLSQICLKLINFYVFFGVIVAYILGYFLKFTTFSLVVMIMTSAILMICLFLPHSASEYLRFGKMKEAQTMIKYLQPNANVDCEIQQLNLDLITKVEDLSIFQVLRKRELRKPFALIGLLTFFQQFSGPPSTIVYAQMIFAATQLPDAELFAICYVILFFISNFIGVFYCNRFNRKTCLLFSSITVSAALVLNICVFFYDFNYIYWKYSSLLSMFIYIFFHSIGLGVIPAILIPEYFPDRARNVVSKFQIILHSALAIIITKVFQVLFTIHHLYVPFLLFLSVSFSSTLFVIAFVPYRTLEYVKPLSEVPHSTLKLNNIKESVSFDIA